MRYQSDHETLAAELADYQVDPVRGFLPAEDPPLALPEPFAEWDHLGAELPYLLLTGRVRQRLKNFPTPPLDGLKTPGQLERAMLIVSALGMAYVWGGPEPVSRLPAALAVPWTRLARRLERPPIIAHASAVLNNWRRVNPDGPLEADNLACVQHFLGGMDEQWFFTATAGVERVGAPALPLLVEAKMAAEKGNAGAVLAALEAIIPIFEAVNAALLRMYERCDPHIFYHRVRPFLAGWDQQGLIYEGVSETPLRLHGGSAAQSSLIQAYDAALGIEHLHPETHPFLTLMREYMPPPHRDFIQRLGEGVSLHDFVTDRHAGNAGLRETFNTCVVNLDQFRKGHMELAVRYILHQSADDQGRGTGGTAFVPFLSRARKETQSRRI